ncbi:Flagellar hook-length control protein FliK [Cupriavidus sp. U2]|uniref:flagellar hook-length control protein FliK n=1 Tax=Cupriavidus sp. U2 TaxID=2920269 RepID=UPI00129E81FE|nr:flagellar hook-length control protein FliK [Cupriavidus sp. U2]KAI3590833.1 Flagellar hook-length control protein FliK [Cupriavidus sp. U2]
MIDISQIVGNTAAALGNLKSPDAGKVGDANPFQDALSRARQDGQQSAPAAAQAKVPAKDGKQAEASKGSATQKPQQPAANNALPQKDTGKVAAKGDAKTDEAKDGETDDTASADAAAAAAALAAAALLTQPPVPQAPAAASTAGVDTSAIDGLPTLPSAQGAAQGASASAAAAAASASTAAAAAADPAADAAALQAQAEARLPAATVDTAAKGTTASPADTLALIAQQRATLQNSAPTTADKIAATVTAPAQAAAQDARGQGAGQQHANLGHQNQPALTPAGDAPASQPAQAPVTPFAVAQASARTGEGVDTGATNASSAATIASALAAQTPAQAAQANAAAVAVAARPVIAPNVGDSQWSQALGQQMVRLSTQGNQTAELDLNPPNLGPLKVVLNVVNDQAQAQFVSPHQAVRAAVEAALPHLRTSMAEAGIQLGQTSVGADSFAQANSGGQQQQPQRHAGNGSSFGQAMGFGNDTAAPAAPATPRAPRTLARGEVDTFA